jgi:2-keto-4-pentenoate hydratase/2-oxohepta-3-ene-1,7-dioic acid hydratase in catechol pathway
MKLVSFHSGDTARLGALVALNGGEYVVDLAAAHARQGSAATIPSEILALLQAGPEALELARSVVEGVTRAATAGEPLGDEVLIPAGEVRLAAPIPRPGKFICVGLNYSDHAAETGAAIPVRPILFAKFANAIVGPGEPVVIPPITEKPDYEAELCFVIGRTAKNVSRDEALSYVAGYTCVNDVSARDLQIQDGQWLPGKFLDTFAPMGPCLVTADEIPDPQALAIRLRLNGETVQDSSTAQMIFGVAELVHRLSQMVTLEPGDVVITGTPPGVGMARKPPLWLKDGDQMEVEIEGIGVLANPVRRVSA